MTSVIMPRPYITEEPHLFLKVAEQVLCVT